MDEVWKLIYEDFENGLHGAWKTVTASNAMRNEIQFRLQKSLAEYKAKPSGELLDSIRADIMLAASVGYITAETAEKAQNLLDKMV